MKSRTQRASRKLARATAPIEFLEPRAYLNGVVLGTPSSFTPAGLHPSFTTLTSTTVDFNGDGKADLVISDKTDSEVALLLGDGNGGFGAPVVKAVGTSPVPVVVADMNGDGHQDILSGNAGSISIVSGDGAGGLTTVNTINTLVASNDAVAVGDFNGDGRMDIVTVSDAPGAATPAEILLQQSDGSFTQQALNTGGHTGLATVAVGDFGNGHADIAIADQFDNKVSVLIGNGTGTFAAPVDYTTGAAPTSMVVADFNGDSKLDIVTANSQGGSVSFLKGNGDGTFQPRIDTPVEGSPAGGGPLKVRFAQMNTSDSLPDLLVLLPASSGNDGAVLLGNGDGTFHTGTIIKTNGAARTSLAAGNLNPDNYTDVIVADSNTITTLLNVTASDTQAPTAAVSATQPAGPNAGATTVQFSVTYTDNTQVDASTLGDGNLTVTGPGGYSQPATWVRQNLGNGPSVIALYTIPFPAGVSTANNGTYTVTMNAHQVKDANGNEVAAGPIGTPTSGRTFAINVGSNPPPTGGSGDITVTPPAGKFGTSVVAGSKGTPVKVKVTNTSGATFKGIYVVNLVATPANGGSPIVLASVSKKVNLKNGKGITVAINKWNYPTPVGDYFIGAQVNNSTTASNTTAVHVAQPFINLNDLTTAAPATMVPGKKMNFAIKVQNTGNVQAHGTIAVTLDAVGAGNAVTPLAQAVPVKISISAGKTATLHVRFTVPTTLTAGASYTLSTDLRPVNLGGISYSSNTPLASTNTFTA